MPRPPGTRSTSPPCAGWTCSSEPSPSSSANGSGKSTIVEALAGGAGFNAEGGGRNLRFETLATHSELHRHVELRWRQRPRWGWFLRAETFYGMATHIARHDGPGSGIASLFPDLHGRSHGQSFLELIRSRCSSPGLYVMDEPESALSFHGQLQLLRFITTVWPMALSSCWRRIHRC